MFLLCCVSPLHADITVRLSVKFILKPDGTRPDAGDIGTIAGFDAEVARGNGILAATGRGFKMQVTYDDIRPPAPNGQSSAYWFTNDARGNRAIFEAAALADQTNWKWRTDAINIYVNNSSSGQCSFVGSGASISLGNDVGLGTVLHEIGHFFDLRHTHAGDPACSGPPYFVADGDGLSATIPDHVCLDQDGLSRSNYQGRAFTALNPLEQAYVNSSWLNVMSYHQEDQLLDEQMDIWTKHANGARRYVCNAQTWFVAIGGSDSASGTEPGEALETVQEGLVRVGSPNDVIVLWRGAYSAPANGIISTVCTLTATRGPAVLTRP